MDSWRRFPFFDRDLVRQPNLNEPHQYIANIEVRCVASGRGLLVFGDTEGYISFLDRNYQLVGLTVRAFDGPVCHLQQSRHNSLLFAIGREKEFENALKVYNLEVQNKDYTPTCVRVQRLKFAETGVTITCTALSDNASMFAVGLDNGHVFVITGDFLRGRVNKIVHVRHGGRAVTGLEFAVASRPTLFAVTESSIVSYELVGSDFVEHLLEDLDGAGAGCSALKGDGQSLIVGRSEGIFEYRPDVMGSSQFMKMRKTLVRCFRSYVAVSCELENTTVLYVYDPTNSLVAYRAPFDAPISFILSEWGSLFVMTKDKKMYALQEKDAQSKLEMIFRKNLYDVAIRLAKSQQYDPTLMVDIFRKYGDYLYSKGDFDQAMQKYIKTIGRLEPSYVIRQFLDAQRIHNLTDYLEELHRSGGATPDHTTLLLNCYTKLKNVTKLNEFIMSSSGQLGRSGKTINIEVVNAIKVLRQASYQRHALLLAERNEQHDWYLKILIDDMHRYSKALAYIRKLEFHDAEPALAAYTRVLMRHLPARTTHLLKRLCTEWERRIKPALKSESRAKPAAAPAADRRVRFSESPGSGSVDDVRDALFARSAPTPTETQTAQEEILRSSPDDFLHVFVGRPAYLIEFLEYIISNTNASSAIYNTLLEVYLSESTDSDAALDELGQADDDVPATSRADVPDSLDMDEEEEPDDAPLHLAPLERRQQSALLLLKNPQAKYDLHQALILVQMHDFTEGILYLYEKKELFHEIVQTFMDKDDYDSVLRECDRHGQRDPKLWVQALSYFAKKPDGDTYIAQVIQHIEAQKIIPPLLVVQILAQNRTTTLSMVRDYLVSKLQEEETTISQEEGLIQRLVSDNKRMRNELNELQTTAKVFQSSKCSSCNSALELPAVHFLCMHSFHQRCLLDNERECPICAKENRKIFDVRRQFIAQVSNHTKFFKLLNESPDGFAVVAEYLGRSIFHREQQQQPQQLQPQPSSGASALPVPQRFTP